MNRKEKAELRKLSGIGRYDHLKLKTIRGWENACFYLLLIPASIQLGFRWLFNMPIDFRHVPQVRRRKIK